MSVHEKLYFEQSKNCETLKDLLIDFYSKYSHDNYNRKGYSRITYLDVGLTEVESFARRRSFEDLLVLSKTYFPDTTEEILMQTLYDIDISFYFCAGIKKIVFHYKGDHSINSNSFNGIVTYQILENTWKGKDLAEICKNIGL